MMNLLLAILLIVAALACWALTLLNVPGNWLMVGAAALYAYFVPADARVAIGWTVVATLLALAALGEMLEFLASAAGTTKAGGSVRAAVLALVGSLVGAVFGAVLGLPIPLVGPIFAALLFAGLGAMAGALLGERWAGKNLDASWPVGKAAFWGRLLGTLGKVLVGAVMAAVLTAAILLD